ncbi:MAG TPA: HD domain-containing phosphohydrolase [Solirubrobacteraceae bacterium]
MPGETKRAGASAVRGTLGELLAALSLATDLGNGFPLEKTLRTCLIALAVGRRLDLDDAELADVYYLALLRSIACTSFAPEQGRALAGDDVAARRLMSHAYGAPPPEVQDLVQRKLGEGLPADERARAVAWFREHGRRLGDEMCLAHYDVGVRLAERLGVGARVGTCLGQVWERYDGLGMPNGLRGEELPIATRIVHLAFVVEVEHAVAGPAQARAEAQRRAGTHFDPAAAAAFADCCDELELDAGAAWERVVEAEPWQRPRRPAGIDDLAAVLADFADLKSVYTLGHSSGVAGLAAGAAAVLGFGAPQAEEVRRAALVQELGRVSVPNRVWDREGPLSAGDWERVRMHPHHTERVLAYSPLLEPLGRLAAAHHERLDGSGYHRGTSARALSTAARVLAAADSYHAMREPRPHRPALAAPEARAELEAQARAGRLDAEAVAAVLAAAGEVPPRRAWPAELTGREVEVLRLIARGQSSAQVAAGLVISKRTVDHHVAHVYRKIGVSSRAGAALFAIEQGLLTPDLE